jgi:hypothetical protein
MSFFSRPAQPSNGAAHAGRADQHPMRLFPELAVLLQRGVVVGGQLRGQAGVEGRAFLGRTAWNRFGSQLARLAALAQIPFDGRERDLEHLHNLSAWGAVIDGVENALAEVG